MKITVKNWESHQERTDRGNYVWFKFYNRFWEDEKIFPLKPAAKFLFVYLLTLCSKASSDTVEFFPAMAALHMGTGRLPLEDLVAAGLVDCQETAGEVTGKSLPREEKRREEKKYACDLEFVYQLYPKRPNQRKAYGVLRLERDMRTAEDYEKLKRAVANYAKYCEANCVEPQYVKQFGTWSGEWREWVDQDAPFLKEMKGDWHG